MREFWVTTEDNPFDPFTQFDDWDRFDQDKGYFTCNYIARIANLGRSMLFPRKSAHVGFSEPIQHFL